MSSPSEFVVVPSSPERGRAGDGLLGGWAGAGGRASAAGLVLVLVLAAVLRFSSIGFGPDLPGARPDEPGVVEGLRAMHEGWLFPSLVLYGGGYFQPLYGYATVRAWLRGTSLPSLLAGDRFAATRVVRSWSAILSTATVLLVFLCAARLAGGSAGVFAALLLATAPLAVREAHFAKADSAAAFASAVFLLAVVWAPRRPVARAASIGAAAAFALSSKAVVGVLPAAILALVRPDEARDRRASAWALAVGGVVMVAVGVTLNVFLLQDPAASLTLARASADALSRVDWLAGSEEVGGPLVYHASISLLHGCGWFLALLALPALVWGLWRDARTRVIAVYALVEWVKLFSSPMVLARFFLPIVPALVVLSSVAVRDLLARFGPASRTSRAGSSIVLALVACTAPLLSSVALVRALGRDDTRSLAASWIATELPRDAVIVTWGTPRSSLVEWGVPPVGGRRTVRSAPPAIWTRIGATHVLVHAYPLPHSSVAPPRELAGLQPVAVFEPRDGEVNDEPVLEPLDAFYLPLARADGFVRPGPRIEIFELPR